MQYKKATVICFHPLQPGVAFRLSDVFRGYRKAAPGCNGLKGLICTKELIRYIRITQYCIFSKTRGDGGGGGFLGLEGSSYFLGGIFAGRLVIHYMLCAMSDWIINMWVVYIDSIIISKNF